MHASQNRSPGQTLRTLNFRLNHYNKLIYRNTDSNNMYPNTVLIYPNICDNYIAIYLFRAIWEFALQISRLRYSISRCAARAFSESRNCVPISRLRTGFTYDWVRVAQWWVLFGQRFGVEIQTRYVRCMASQSRQHTSHDLWLQTTSLVPRPFFATQRD